MNNEDFVSFEIAKALKKAGFDWPVLNGYSQKMRIESDESFGNIKNVHSKSPKNYNDNRKGIAEGVEFCSMPTLAQAQKWLREKKGVAVSIQAELTNGELWYSADICSLEFENTLVDGGFPYKAYESALSAGIEAALKLIEEGEV